MKSSSRKSTRKGSLLVLLLALLLCQFSFSIKNPFHRDEINFGGGSCSGCTDPGHFCGVDNQCHPFSCQNYYQYADRKLTGYADNTTFQCFGYSKGDQENAHGVIYGCDPLFPFTLMTPGKQVTEPFNRKCTAEREGGYMFECYEYLPSETATDFTFFEREAESSFPDCEDGKQPKYYYIIASSNHYVGFEGLQGNPIVSSGADDDGDTMWQSNPGRSFNREIAMYSMYANVVGGPGPATGGLSIEAGPLGNNPLRNPGQGNGDRDNGDSGANDWRRSSTAYLVGVAVGIVGLLV